MFGPCLKAGVRSSSGNVVLRVRDLGMPWATQDPFLFAVYHDDLYPAGDERMGPLGGTAGHRIGADFGHRSGWNMYHGEVIPGFPKHPHRGFETVTIVRHGTIDHFDSLGSCGRFGGGDTQWMTAGSGICHSEMFPLLNRNGSNRLELFQIWLNLPQVSKMAEPFYKMLWAEHIPHVQPAEGIHLSLIAGKLAGANEASEPPPQSWAAREDSDIAIWIVRLAPRSSWQLPTAALGDAARRSVYFFKGDSAKVGGASLSSHCAVEVRADVPCELSNAGSVEAEFLMLQGRPIDEPVVQHGPFVMNDKAGIHQAFKDYQRDQFGGWPWPDDAPAHDINRGRFAQYADGRNEEPEGSS
mmetsp:Transcript_68223/g.134821  ORF Transcript_68223/g.134821 Transcript_68223/m.134821 type:complete len:355 (-) Transcript_68223:162-1226(-)|eukprot:CAMPEP_0172723912 /NCGR_PEP_ID=MMETSP1074-20121228/84793_1 /TAXON_ID=2916 /ORGANISM="Ceratium fusus, Strain PA161109" /LENGTH=354 /DNA_ID=CAMNT_0013550253 /DNA_START=86 /DNA_END=1150 /DNA_ORIENTATION=+